jgi:DNA-binding NarL/FixJ family response regulator
MRERAVAAIVCAGMSLRCLIVDDNSSFREEMNALLEEQGIDVVGGAASGMDAVEQVAELQPDVALVDIDLGGESGFALARRLLADAGDGGGPKVILISTHDEGEYADLIEASCAVGFLAKTQLSAAAIRRMLGTVDDAKLGGTSRSDERRGT